MIVFQRVLLALFNAIFFVCPFPKIDELAALAAKRAEAIGGVPDMYFAALRTGNDWWFRDAGHGVFLMQSVKNITGSRKLS